MPRPQTIRITGGQLRGRVLAVPDGFAVRPTAARTREALFNRLAHGSFGPDGASVLPGARVADLCCGTGALGFEALSRGAASALFADQDDEVLEFCRQSANKLQIAEACRFMRLRLPAMPPTGPFDLVFLDPPYASGVANASLEAFADSALLFAEALLSVETAADERLSIPRAFVLLDERRYGAARLWLLQRR